MTPSHIESRQYAKLISYGPFGPKSLRVYNFYGLQFCKHVSITALVGSSETAGVGSHMGTFQNYCICVLFPSGEGGFKKWQNGNLF